MNLPSIPAWGWLTLIALLGGCVSQETVQTRVPEERSDPRRVEDLALVDCLLPGQVRQLGTRMTYLSPRRYIKTTQSDCGIRGGEFIRFDRADYRTALQVLLPKARAGDAVAQTYVGEIYEKGLGLPAPDYAAAARWYAQAAAQGYAPAQTNLGLLYERGLGVPRDKAKALNWYRKATGITQDPLIFESQLKSEREAFQREIALRNRIAATLRQQLKAAQDQNASPLSKAALKRLTTSLHRDVESEQEQVQRRLHAVRTLEKEMKKTSSTKKTAQMGKLELSLRQQSDALADNRYRLAMMLK